MTPTLADIDAAIAYQRSQIDAAIAYQDTHKIERYYPETGLLRRELYVKHCEFFESGVKYRERLCLSANRTGKTEGIGAYEMTLHLTGNYPAWWKGKRFKRGINAWAAGDTSKTVRDIIQQKLLGPPGAFGTGMIPKDALVDTSAKAGLADAVDTIMVRHASGGTSRLVLKSYDQRREAFQGTEQDLIWLDEESDEEIYTECLMRTMPTGSFKGGMVILTFTPLMGLTPLVLQFIPGGKPQDGPVAKSTKFITTMTWDDAPHLSQEAKDELWASIPLYQREARSKGIPSLGSGAIYPVPEADITVADFEIPVHWPRCWALDTGWNWTACVWMALDRESQTLYVYSEYKRSEAEPLVHAAAIKARGEWIPGVGDAAAISNYDGKQFIQIYRDLGLNIELPDKGVESGIHKVWQLMSGGRLKIFKSCTGLLEELRLYRRDEKGRIVKQNDHLCDGFRYGCVSGVERMCVKPMPKRPVVGQVAEGEWMSW